VQKFLTKLFIKVWPRPRDQTPNPGPKRPSAAKDAKTFSLAGVVNVISLGGVWRSGAWHQMHKTKKIISRF